MGEALLGLGNVCLGIFLNTLHSLFYILLTPALVHYLLLNPVLCELHTTDLCIPSVIYSWPLHSLHYTALTSALCAPLHYWLLHSVLHNIDPWTLCLHTSYICRLVFHTSAFCFAVHTLDPCMLYILYSRLLHAVHISYSWPQDCVLCNAILYITCFWGYKDSVWIDSGSIQPCLLRLLPLSVHCDHNHHLPWCARLGPSFLPR